MKSLIRIASVAILVASCAFAQTTEEPARPDYVPGVLPKLNNSPTVSGQAKRPPVSRSSVRKKRFVPAGSTPQPPIYGSPHVAPETAASINSAGSLVWPQPLGSTAISPKATNYQPAAPVRRHIPVPLSSQPADEVEVEPVDRIPPHALPPWPNVNEQLSFYPHDNPPSELPEPQPEPYVPQPQVPQPQQYTTSLPEELGVPMYVPVGPATGRASSLIPDDEQPQGIIPMIAQRERFTPPPTWDPRTVSCGQPYVYWHPMMMPGAKPVPAGGALSVQLFDRFLNGGYGQTDQDGQLQADIQFLINAGAISGP